jgi:hypothetical protein
MSKALRNELLKVPVVVWEKKQIDRLAREANLNTTDYIREKLGLAKARKTRNQKDEALENPEGDPDNAVDVEELARRVFAETSLTKAEARREAKRRLELAAAERG